MKKVDIRKKEILDLLVTNEDVKIEDLVKHLNVSDVTIRRTLIELEKEGKVIRTHGGVKLYRKSFDYFFDKKVAHNIEQKRAIGQKAADLIKSNEVIFLDSGTTVLRVAESIARRIEGDQVTDITIVTNSIAVAEVLGDLCKVIILGGQVRLFRKDLYGPLVEKNIRMFRADKSFIGADALSLKDGLMTTDEYTSKIDEEMIRRGSEVILVVDSSKFNSVSFVSFANVNNIDIIISDRGVDDAVKKEFEGKGVKLILS